MNKKWDFALLDQTGGMGIALDRDGNIVDWNAGCARVSGYSFDEVRGRCFWDFLLPAEEREAARERFFKRLNGRGPAEFENVWITKSGRHRFIAWSDTTFAGPNGQVEHVVGIGIDLTDRCEADRERLRAAVQARDDVLAMVSHDLKNPVSAILMSTSLLARLPLPDEAAVRVRDAANRIRRAAEHMNDLICNLVDAASIEAGRLSVTLKPQEVEGLIDDVIKMMLPIATERTLRLEPRFAGALPPVDCDRERILQVFSNLIGNAIRFAPSGGAITVTAERAGQALRFGVADTGGGFPAEALPHLFDRYWRSGQSTRASAGLGLYIVKGIVEAHGGAVWPENLPGGGAAIFFTLPAAV